MCLHPSSEANERDKKVFVVPRGDLEKVDEEDETSFEEKCETWRQKVRGCCQDQPPTKQQQRLLTTWGERLDVEEGLPHAEYPRPAMVRDEEDWVCLNGFWQYAVKRIEKGSPPRKFDGDILVPFPIESALSGVERRITKDDFLWYRRTFSLPKNFSRKTSRLLLHFGAVDWQAIIFINGQAVGEHSGGYDPFEFDITRFLNHSGTAQQEVVVRVYDPTDEGIQPRGKQCSDPFTSKRVVAPLGMWYTPNSGIWQTVWLESVPKEAYIHKCRIIPNVDANTVTVTASVRQEVFKRNHGLFVRVTFQGEVVGFASGSTHYPVEVKLSESHKTKLWTPSTPHLYDIEIYLHDSIIPKSSNNHVDVVRSYTAMRKISVGEDVNGVKRLQLNNKNLFQYGILDQGWWPDGLYTPASDEALRWDIQLCKNMGFNMIRKHVKVEPQRWYYHCDKIGMLVWQDMPNGSMPAEWAPNGEKDYSENPLDPLFAKIFEDELSSCVDALYNHPCIAVWVPFNEAWGQYNSVEVVTWLEHYDRSRLVWLSGGNDFGVGSAIDRHVYPEPEMPPPGRQEGRRARRVWWPGPYTRAALLDRTDRDPEGGGGRGGRLLVVLVDLGRGCLRHLRGVGIRPVRELGLPRAGLPFDAGQAQRAVQVRAERGGLHPVQRRGEGVQWSGDLRQEVCQARRPSHEEGAPQAAVKGQHHHLQVAPGPRGACPGQHIQDAQECDL